MKLWLTAGAVAIAIAIAAAGCGLGPGPGTKDASIVVTRDFGSDAVGQYTQKRVPGAETVLQMLERSFSVATRYSGNFVESINGHGGNSNHLDWFYYVNGIEAPKGAGTTAVNHGDHIWWDLHDWVATDSIPAVVGSFPEPFTSGIGGKRFPTVLDCANDATAACGTVAKALTKAGVKVADQALGGGSGSDSLAIVVGTYSDIRGVIASELIKAGPSQSGVYAQFVGANGQAIELDDPAGQVVRTLRGSAGLIAATEQPSLNEPAWLVTGTDVAGVEEAASALTPAKLHDHFAVAVAGGQDLPLPLLPSQ